MPQARLRLDVLLTGMDCRVTVKTANGQSSSVGADSPPLLFFVSRLNFYFKEFLWKQLLLPFQELSSDLV